MKKEDKIEVGYIPLVYIRKIDKKIKKGKVEIKVCSFKKNDALYEMMHQESAKKIRNKKFNFFSIETMDMLSLVEKNIASKEKDTDKEIELIRPLKLKDVVVDMSKYSNYPENTHIAFPLEFFNKQFDVL